MAGRIQGITVEIGGDTTKLTSAFKGVNTEIKSTQSQLKDVEKLEYMSLAGWTTTDMVDGIGGIMDAAAASGENLAATSDIVTDGLTAFGLSAKDAGHFADVLVKTGNSSNTTVSMMGETFKYAGAVCGSFLSSACSVFRFGMCILPSLSEYIQSIRRHICTKDSGL